MSEILDRHWRDMRRMREIAIKSRRAFKPPIRAEVVEELHRVARNLLATQEPKWLSLKPVALANRLNAMGLKTYGGRSYDPDSARNLRKALLAQDVTQHRERQAEKAEIAARMSAVIPKLNGAWSDEVWWEANGLALASLPDDADPLIKKAAEFLMKKLETYEAKAPKGHIAHVR